MYRVMSLLCAAFVMVAATSFAQEAGGEPSMDEMMKKMQEVATPGPHHAALAELVGEWDVEVAMVMPGVPRQASKGTATYEWIIEGRWLGHRIDAKFMGMPYQSFSVIGYDNFAKNHVVVTVSNLDTAMNLARGVVVDPSGDTQALYGTLDEYTTGELEKPFKVVSRKIDDDHHVTEIWDLGIGADGAKVIEYTYSRRK